MPNWILVPGILVLSVIGVYSTHASIFAIYLMLAIGIAGWLLRKAGFDMAPIILGFVLGKVMEVNLRNALAISGGDLSILFHSTISLVLWALAIAVAVLPALLGWRAKRRRQLAAAEASAQ
jgi:putative tricarboxylic transport membrane protein